MKIFLQNYGKKCCAIICLISIPLIFNFIFHGDETSRFFFIHSSIGVSNWFSFWVTYISAIVTGILSYITYKLTNSIEQAHCEETATQNKRLFEIEEVSIKCTENLEQFIVKIKAPLELKRIRFESACITINNSEIQLECKDKNIARQYLTLSTAIDRDIKMWKDYVFNMQQEYRKANLQILFSYTIQFADKNMVWFTKTICEIEAQPQNNEEKVNILDVFVLTSKNK